MEYTKEDLIEAKRQIDSTLHKLRETIITFEAKENPERYKSQITLGKRRIKAFEIVQVPMPIGCKSLTSNILTPLNFFFYIQQIVCMYYFVPNFFIFAFCFIRINA